MKIFLINKSGIFPYFLSSLEVQWRSMTFDLKFSSWSLQMTTIRGCTQNFSLLSKFLGPNAACAKFGVTKSHILSVVWKRNVSTPLSSPFQPTHPLSPLSIFNPSPLFPFQPKPPSPLFHFNLHFHSWVFWLFMSSPCQSINLSYRSINENIISEPGLIHDKPAI